MNVRHRLAFAAAHVAMLDDYAACSHTFDRPGSHADIAPHIDWPTTSALRCRLDRLGFGIAEAMDTAQRFELGWPTAQRLIEMTGRLDLEHGFVAGAGTDHVVDVGIGDLARAVADQVGIIRSAGGVAVILPMARLAREHCDPETYVRVYAEIADRVGGPLLVHWLGPMFVPDLDGYFPEDSFERVMALDAEVFRGAKLSMLDRDLELRLRRSLRARNQLLLTGDDWNFADLIVGDGAPTATTTVGPWTVSMGDFSHALLGILDGVAPAARRGLDTLESGESAEARRILEACAGVGRVVFEAPTHLYKAGLAFLAWVDGIQPNPMLANRLDLARTGDHYRRVMAAARDAELFEHPDEAEARYRASAVSSSSCRS